MSEIIRLSLDEEFNDHIDLGHFSAVDLISIGLVNVDDPNDNGFYAVSSEFNRKAAEAHDFLNEQVLSKLHIMDQHKSRDYSIEEISTNIKIYLKSQIEKNPKAEKVEFWAKNGSYDHYLLCRLFGGMHAVYDFMNENGVKKTKFRDLNELKFPENPSTPKPIGDEDRLHNAFYDVCHQAEIMRWVEANDKPFCSETAAMNAAVKKGLVR